VSVDKLHKCAGRYCPGLPYDPFDQAHPLTCSVPFEARRHLIGDLAPDANPILDDVRRFITTRPIPAVGASALYPDGAPTREPGGEWVDAAKMRGTRYVGTSGQAEWPPKDDGERRIWPPIQLTGTGPITDADVEAAEACVAGLMPWTINDHGAAPSELAALAERIATLTAERDDLRETVDQIAEHVGAKTRGARPAFARWLRDEVRLFVANLTRERDTAIDAFHRCRIERDQACTSGDAAAFAWADERSALIGERNAARAEVARLTAELNAANDDHTRPE